MQIPNTNSGLLLTIMTIAGIMVTNVPMAFGQTSLLPSYPNVPMASGQSKLPSSPRPKGIRGMPGFVRKCGIYMHRLSPWFLKPNEKCCVSAREVNIKLFCKIFIIRDLRKAFKPAKVAAVAKHCGTPLPPGTKCGNYIVR